MSIRRSDANFEIQPTPGALEHRQVANVDFQFMPRPVDGVGDITEPPDHSKAAIALAAIFYPQFLIG